MKINKQNEIIKKLVSDFDSVESEVIRMVSNHGIFQEIVEISKKNPKISRGNSFWDFIKESYVALMVSAVCRQIDTDTRSSSLINLLMKLLQADITTILTKDWYSKKYHKDDDLMLGFMEGIGKDNFESNFGLKDFVDPDIIRADIERLTKETNEIKRFRNKRIAHRDSNNNLVFAVNFNDLERSVESIREIASKYYLLLKNSSNDLKAIDQTDWQEMFTIPWIKKATYD